MKKLLIKWLCRECIEDVSRVYFGSVPVLGESLFYLYRDKDGNDSYKLLSDGVYLHNGNRLTIKNEIVTGYELNKGITKG